MSSSLKCAHTKRSHEATLRTIASRQLKEHLGEVLRHVRERGEENAITHRGKTIARIVPERPLSSEHDHDAWLAEADRLSAEIAHAWPPDLSAAQAVSDDRREL